MAERKPYTTKTRQIILEYLKSQKAVTVSVADIEKYLNLIDKLTKTNSQMKSEIELLEKKLDFYFTEKRRSI